MLKKINILLLAVESEQEYLLRLAELYQNFCKYINQAIEELSELKTKEGLMVLKKIEQDISYFKKITQKKLEQKSSQGPENLLSLYQITAFLIRQEKQISKYLSDILPDLKKIDIDINNLASLN